MRLLLRAGFDRYSGYGNDAVDLAVALEKRGVDVTPWPTGVLPGLPKAFTDLLTKTPVPGSYDVMMHFAPPFDCKPEEDAGLAAKTVGYSMWERDRLLPGDMNGWKHKGSRKHWWSKSPHYRGKKPNWYDAMIVTCPMNVPAFEALDPHLPYHVVPCGISPDDFPVMERPYDRPLTFGMIGVLGGRKDPFALLLAWKDLKEQGLLPDARLKVHDMSTSIHPRSVEVFPDMVLTQKAVSRQALLDWYGSVDVLVSTSRGEGNNKPAMEFMATGGPVIATDWSGHQNWLHPHAAWPIPGTLVPVAEYCPARDFRADQDALKQALLEAYADRDLVRKKGRVAATWIRDTLSWEQVAVQMEKVLAGLQ
jgi:glycosyltransferase involved in cell wall biosynthesis